jgi:hypothetical protein
MTEDRIDLEIVQLEELFNEESKCQMKHTHSSCTTEVTHVAIDCKKQVLVCANGAELIEKMIKLKHACRACNKSAADCWRLVAA